MQHNASHNQEPWIEVIRNKAQQAEAPVPDGAWDAIAARIESKPVQPQKPKTASAKAAARPWMKWAAAAAAVAAIASGAIFLMKNDNNISNEKTKLAHIKQQPVPAAPTEETNNADGGSHNAAPTSQMPQASQTPDYTTTTTAPTTAKTVAKPKKLTPTTLGGSSLASTMAANNKPTTSQSGLNSQEEAVKPAQESEDYFAADQSRAAMPKAAPMPVIEKSIPDMMAMAEPMDEQTMPSDDTYDTYYDDTYDETAELDELTDVDELNRSTMRPWREYSERSYRDYISLNRSVSKFVVANDVVKKKHARMMLNLTGGGMLASAHGNSSATVAARPMMAPARAQATPIDKPADYSYDHHLPLTFGVHASRSLYGNLYGSLGVNFTYMHSDVTEVATGQSFSQNVKLIGIPFGLKWNFWHWRGLSTYVGGEGVAERVVGARFHGEDISIKRWQWSVHAMAGVQYNFSRRIGVFLEPKLSHYITTMPISTQRDQHTFNFNLQMGLSVDL